MISHDNVTSTKRKYIMYLTYLLTEYAYVKYQVMTMVHILLSASTIGIVGWVTGRGSCATYPAKVLFCQFWN